MGQLIQELKRRNVIRVAIAYAVSAWLLIQVSATTFPMLRLPDWTATFVMVLLLIGFPMALILAWAFEITPEGIKLEKHVVRDESITHLTGRNIDYVIIAMLVVSLGYFGYDKFILEPDRNAAEIEAAVQTAREQVASAVEKQESSKTIAVLPFVNMSDDASNEYFSDGISEEILNLLAQVPNLAVTSRSSAFSFKGQNVDVRTIAAKLMVAHVLEGSVRKFGNQLRITAQLIDVDTDTHLWSKTYDRELQNVFAIQGEIAADVVDELQITLLGKDLKVAETSPEAYALYLQALSVIRLGSQEGYEQAETLLEQAVAIDSDYAPAWAMLSQAYRVLVSIYNVHSSNDGWELARGAALRALAIDPESARAHSSLSRIEWIHDRNLTMAYQRMQKAIALNPNDALVLRDASRMELSLRHYEKAIDLGRRAVALDPLNASHHRTLAYIYYHADLLDQAAASIRLTLSLRPGEKLGRCILAKILLKQQDPAAPAYAQKQIDDGACDGNDVSMFSHTLGDAAASDAALQEYINDYASGYEYQIAIVYAFRGEIDNAFEWLQRGYDNDDPGLTDMAMDRDLASLHEDPRWEPFLDKLGLPH